MYLPNKVNVCPEKHIQQNTHNYNSCHNTNFSKFYGMHFGYNIELRHLSSRKPFSKAFSWKTRPLTALFMGKYFIFDGFSKLKLEFQFGLVSSFSSSLPVCDMAPVRHFDSQSCECQSLEDGGFPSGPIGFFPFCFDKITYHFIRNLQELELD